MRTATTRTRLPARPYLQGESLFVTDNGNHILDCEIHPIPDAHRLETDIRAIPGVVGTGLFLGMADTVLVGDRDDFGIIEERRRKNYQQGPGPVTAGPSPTQRTYSDN